MRIQRSILCVLIMALLVSYNKNASLLHLKYCLSKADDKTRLKFSVSFIHFSGTVLN